MPRTALIPVSGHPVAVVLRLLLRPTMIMELAHLASRTEDDGLAAGLTGFAVVVTAAFPLATADGLVLRTRALVLVWSVTTVVVVGPMVARPSVDALGQGRGATTWDDAVRVVVEDLPTSGVFFLVLVGVPVAPGAVAGAALRRSTAPRGQRADDRVSLG